MKKKCETNAKSIVSWFVCDESIDLLPTASVAPNTDEKLLSETNALVCVAGAENAEQYY